MQSKFAFVRYLAVYNMGLGTNVGATDTMTSSHRISNSAASPGATQSRTRTNHTDDFELSE